LVFSDPSQPGHIYRCVRMAEAACDAGWDARAVAVSDLVDVDIIGLTLLIFWRFELTPSVCRLVALARAGGASVGLDLDDLVFDPMLARSEVIDGMRSMGMTNADVRLHFFGVQKFLLETDFGLCTTKELANQMRRTGKPIWVIPNGFDQATHDAARIAMRARPNDGLLRIGYAAGTKTHQRDLQVAAPALGRILAAYPAARLVLFRQASDGAHFIGLEEMPALAAVGAQIEWRTQVALADLPSELARFDINIAPLEVGNPFVEAKSELKFFEAALVEVPTIASPTGPFRRAIRDGVTGVLADSDAAWAAALRTLLNNAGQRSRMGSAAYRDAIVRFGPDARGKVIKAALLAIVAASAR
jgi:glycosyltransferase involved in cell wall biosynthesis